MGTTNTAGDRRIGLRGLFVLGLFVVLVLTVGVGSASAAKAYGWCSESNPAPCIVSASVNGSTVTDEDANYQVDLNVFSSSAPAAWFVQVESQTNGFDLGTGATSDDWSIVVDVGSMDPRVAFAVGQNVTFTRPTGSGNLMTISGNPVTEDVNDTPGNSCDFSGSLPTCPTYASADYTTFNAEVDDFDLPNQYTPAQIDSFYGMNLYSNIDELGIPPEIEQTTSGNELVIQMANQHYYPDGTTVFYGFLHLFIPYSFMEQVWDINDPSTIATDGLAASIGTGSLTINQQTGGLEVDITGITFSRRKLVIRRGDVTPTRPRHLHARRSAGSARISFHASKPRGEKISGYEVTCKAPHWPSVSERAKHPPLTVHGLHAGTRYRCAVRARSKAGAGRAAYIKLGA